MASATEIKDGREARFSLDKVERTRVWLAREAANEIEAAEATGVAIGAPHPANTDAWRAYAEDCDVRSLGASKWRVTIRYGSRDDRDWTSAPWTRPAVGSSATTPVEVYVPVDLDGKPFIASNRRMFDPIPPVYLPVQTRNVVRSYPGRGYSRVLGAFVGCVNAAAWQGMQPDQCLLAGFNSQQMDWKGVVYEELTWTYQIKPNIASVPAWRSWQQWLLDQGDCELRPGPDGRPLWRLQGEDESDPNTTIRLLDGTGRFLTEQQISQGVFHWTPNSRENGHTVYRRVSFHDFPWA
jgi:hypothetical protein